MHVLAFDRPNFASVAIGSTIVVVFALAVAIPLSGLVPTESKRSLSLLIMRIVFSAINLGLQPVPEICRLHA